MYFGGFMRPRPGSWPLRMALRATVTAATAMVAAIAIDSAALPKLKAESKGLPGPPATLGWVSAFQGHLVYVAVPALLVGIAALVLRPFRRPLALLAMLMSVFALIVIVGSLIAAMAPMYRVPTELGV